MKWPQKEPGPRHLGQPLPPKESEPNGDSYFQCGGASPGCRTHLSQANNIAQPSGATHRWREEPHRQRVHAAGRGTPHVGTPWAAPAPATWSESDRITYGRGRARAPVTPDPAPTLPPTGHGHDRVARDPNPTDAYATTKRGARRRNSSSAHACNRKR